MKNRFATLLCLSAGLSAQAYALPAVIDNSAYPASAAPANNITSATPSNSAMVEMMTRMEQMQADIQQLNGKVEEQAYQIGELKKQQKNLTADFDERLGSLENKTDGSATAPVATPAAVVTDTPATPTEAAPVTKPAAPAVEEKRPIDAEPVAGSASGKPAATAVDKPKAEVISAPDNEKQAYQRAYELLRKGKTDQSITELNSFLENYPSSNLANNAQYWLGEAYRVKKDNEAARKAFNIVIEKYPQSSKIPDALLKLGYIEMDQSHTDQAREYFNKVTSNYPDTPAALYANKKLRAMNAN